jgi:hypothetical protein
LHAGICEAVAPAAGTSHIPVAAREPEEYGMLPPPCARTAFAALSLAVLTAPAASAETGRLFFDLAGNGGTDWAPHPGNLSLTNPALPPGGGRLYLYWQFGRHGGEDSQHVLGLNYNVTVDGGTLTRAMHFNNPYLGGILGPRWYPVPSNPAPNPAINPGGSTQRFTAIDIIGLGVGNGPFFVAADDQYDAASNSTILGYVDVLDEGNAGAEIWITVDRIGIAIQGGGRDDEIYMGFGDGPLLAGRNMGQRSDIPEATIIPEPATVALLMAAMAAVSIRRRCSEGRHLMMRSTITLLASLTVSTAAWAETGRLFFDLAGNGGDQNAPHPGGLALENPVLPPGGGRLYLYWQFGRPGPDPFQSVLGLNYNVTVDNGSISEAMNYNYSNSILGPRWGNAPGNPAPNPPVNPGGSTQRFTAIGINVLGLKNDAVAFQLDEGYDAQTNTTILGYVDVTSPSAAGVWLTVDTLGIAIQGGGPADDIYMGFGDAPVPAGGSPGRRSDLPEATIIPEPATLVLLIAGAAALARSRGAGRRSHTGARPTRDAGELS